VLRAYIDKQFKKASLDLIEQANTIINEYQAQGYDLTLRQLYYQFVARDLLPNTTQSYSRLGSLISDARLAGLVSWSAIEDRTRGLHKLPSWDSPADIVEACHNQYREDLWRDQPQLVEVWVEKEALAGVFQRVCDELRVPLFSCRGYVSQSAMWRAAQRHISKDKTTKVLHFGDHDPSGIDMTRDIKDRLQMFGAPVKVVRVALNMDQIEEYEPPPNPAKTTDARYDAYQAEHGDESWELDALEPAVLAQLVTDNVLLIRDQELWDGALLIEQTHRERLEEVANELYEEA